MNVRVFSMVLISKEYLASYNDEHLDIEDFLAIIIVKYVD